MKTEKNKNVINISNVYKTYFCDGCTVHALNNVSLTVNEGEFVTIIGKSGSGKSTLMNIVGCLDVPTSGDYHILNRDVSKIKDSDLAHIRNKEIGFIFQGFNLIPGLSALENVELPLLYRGVDKKKRRRISLECLEIVGLSNRINHRPQQMSGGQQQRVAIARAISGRPSIILADEPTGNLDSKSGKEVLNILKELNNHGHTVILITHDQNVALNARRIVKISDGKIIDDKLL